ncbi:MAG: hypothetical protein KC713_04260 [Candidatus Omnitrophica bacterium]|nr:hypothetical protein [Candidatus Omnitrophota bacterium]
MDIHRYLDENFQDEQGLKDEILTGMYVSSEAGLFFKNGFLPDQKKLKDYTKEVHQAKGILRDQVKEERLRQSLIKFSNEIDIPYDHFRNKEGNVSFVINQPHERDVKLDTIRSQVLNYLKSQGYQDQAYAVYKTDNSIEISFNPKIDKSLAIDFFNVVLAIYEDEEGIIVSSDDQGARGDNGYALINRDNGLSTGKFDLNSSMIPLTLISGQDPGIKTLYWAMSQLNYGTSGQHKFSNDAFRRSFFVLDSLKNRPIREARVIYLGMGRLIRALLGPKLQSIGEDAIMLEVMNEQTSNHVAERKGQYEVVISHKDGKKQKVIVNNILATGSFQDKAVYMAVNRFMRTTGSKELLIPFGVTPEGIRDDAQAILTLTDMLNSYFIGHNNDQDFKAARIVIINTDNVSRNGERIKMFVQQMVREKYSPSLGEWIDEHVLFAETVVDRITVAGKDSNLRPNPVLSETEGPLPLELALAFSNSGPDIDPHTFLNGALIQISNRYPSVHLRQSLERLKIDESLKLRVFLTAQNILSVIGALNGFNFTQEAIENRVIKKFIIDLYNNGISAFAKDLAQQIVVLEPELSSSQVEADIRAYFTNVLDRIHNPYIYQNMFWVSQDLTERISQRWGPLITASAQRHPKGEVSQHIAFAVAAMMRYLTPMGGIINEEESIFKGSTASTNTLGEKNVYEETLGLYTERQEYLFTDGSGYTPRQLLRLVNLSKQRKLLLDDVKNVFNEIFTGVEWETDENQFHLSDFSGFVEAAAQYYLKLWKPNSMESVIQEVFHYATANINQLKVLVIDPVEIEATVQSLKNQFPEMEIDLHYEPDLGKGKADHNPQILIDRVRQLNPQVLVVGGAHILGYTGIAHRVFEEAPELSYVIRAGVGTDHVDSFAADQAGVRVINEPYGNNESTAEWSLRLLFGTLRTQFNDTEKDDFRLEGILNVALNEYKTAHEYRFQTKTQSDALKAKIMSDYERLYSPITEHEINLLKNKTIGILGFGNIGGQQLAKKLYQLNQLFDLEVSIIAYDHSFDASAIKINTAEKYGVKFLTGIEALFQQSDIVFMHIPGSKERIENEGIINEGLLNLAKPGMVLINAARDTLMDHQALVKHLTKDPLFRYASDVAVENAVFIQNPRVWMSNHVAGISSSADRQVAVNVAVLIKTILKSRIGIPLDETDRSINIVNSHSSNVWRDLADLQGDVFMNKSQQRNRERMLSELFQSHIDNQSKEIGGIDLNLDFTRIRVNGQSRADLRTGDAFSDAKIESDYDAFVPQILEIQLLKNNPEFVQWFEKLEKTEPLKSP